MHFDSKVTDFVIDAQNHIRGVIVNDREKIGTLDVARLYMMNSHHTLNNDATLRFITSESYEKLLSIIENA